MSQPVNLFDFEALARTRLDTMVFEYYAGGSDDGVSVRENRAAFARLALRPHTLVDVSHRNLATTLLGQPLAFPLVIAPLAMTAMAHPAGECAIARAAGAAGIITAVSIWSNYTLEEIAAVASAPLWFQLYVYKDRAIARQLVAQAEVAGYQALVVTTDVPVVGNREADVRNQFRLPAGLRLGNMERFARAMPAVEGASSIAAYVAAQVDAALTWKDVEGLCSSTRMPVLVKGILRADDARRAYDSGAAGIVVSNHGGRQLDTAVTALEALPDIAAAVGEHVDVLIDGGVRRGTDMVKALAFGAKAVMVGRPIVWGLAVEGEHGVRRVLEVLRREFDTAMALCGCTSVADLQHEAGGVLKIDPSMSRGV
jgi:4-hydroxymandelate oxidase